MAEQLSIVADGDGFVVGRPGVPDFVAVPEVGGRVLRWLAAGHSVQECTAKASELAGQPVDVAEFLADLKSAGILTDEQPATPVRAPRGRTAGRLLFGATGLAVQAALALTGLILLVSTPAVRPTYRDAVPFDAPLASLLAVAALAMVLTVAHELAHKLAAARLGVYGRISLSRRLFFIVAQTDLTGLWAVGRRRRIVPLVAGMLLDTAIVGIMLILQVTLAGELSPLALDLIRATVFVNIGALIAQTAVYLRTDLYALILVGTGCQNLWETKGAVARRAIGRPTPDDLRLIAQAPGRELRWARIYLLLYFPGILLATWYYVTFTLRATISLVLLAARSVAEAPTVSLGMLAGVATLALVVIPTTVGLVGAARAAVAATRRLLSS